jgi:hypothetical protein
VEIGELWPLTVSPTLGAGSKLLRAPKPVVIEWPLRTNRNPEPISIRVSLPVFRRSLRSGLPVHNAAVTGSLQPGIAPVESQPKAVVLPLPVSPRPTTQPKTVERSCHPVLRRFEGRMPAPRAEAATRPVWPSASIALHGGIREVLPNLEGFAIRGPQKAPDAQWQHPLAAEPAAVPVAPRFCLALVDSPLAESTAVALPSLERFNPIQDVAMDLRVTPELPGSAEVVRTPEVNFDTAVPRSGCPALAGLTPVPVESMFSTAFVPIPIAATPAADALRLPGVDQVFDVPLPASGSRFPAAGRPGCPTWPSPVPPLIAAMAAPAPTAVEADAPGLLLPGVDLVAELIPVLGMSETCSAWPSPDEAFIPPASVPEPIAAAADALRLPRAVLAAELHSSRDGSAIPAAGRFDCPTWPRPVESLIPAASAPSPMAWETDAPRLALPRLALVAGVLPALGSSGICPCVPTPSQSLIPFALEPIPFAAATGAIVPRLPSLGRTFDPPSLLGQLQKPVAGRESALPSSGGPIPAVAAEPVSSFEPAPVPMRPPAIVLSLPTPGKPVLGSTTAQVGPTPAAVPSPVESLPAIAAFAPFRIGRTPDMQLPQVPATTGTGLPAAGSGQSYPPVAAPEPQAVNPNAPVLRPISFLKVNRLAVPTGRPAPAIPQPGFIPIEFYCQRGLVSPCQRLAWITPLADPILPRFAMRIAVDRTEDLAPWKPAPKAPASQEIPVIPEAAKRRARELAIGRFLKLAACLVMGVSLWYGARELRTGPPAIEIRTSEATADAPAAAGPLAGAAPAGNASKGVMANVRSAIANRAAYSVTDTLQTDMQSWGSPAKSWAPGWSRNPDGYVHTGELALFHPSLGYKDYRLEFFGQIESKSMGWVVRAHDDQNYYAMKFTVIEAGLRPVIAMAHYSVVDGKKGHKVEVPLSVMVHQNTPMHVAVDVQGNRVTASVEGQQVDSWTDDLMPAGGVGFFSEAGERARLYWMKVSKNQDWLGVICSYLSADSRETAEVWGPGLPGNIPAPADPVQPQDAALAEAETGSNDFSSPQRAKTWVQRRIGPWNS